MVDKCIDVTVVMILEACDDWVGGARHECLGARNKKTLVGRRRGVDGLDHFHFFFEILQVLHRKVSWQIYFLGLVSNCILCKFLLGRK